MMITWGGAGGAASAPGSIAAPSHAAATTTADSGLHEAWRKQADDALGAIYKSLVVILGNMCQPRRWARKVSR
jgi:hypothetical protein